MKPVLLEEAFGDSPVFRASLQESETSLNFVDGSIRKMATIAEKITDMTKDYSAKYQALAEEIQSLAGFEDDPSYELIGLQLLKFAQVFKDIERSRMIAASQYKDVFIEPLNNFGTTEIAPAKRAGKDFLQSQDHFLNAMGKYMGKRPQDKGIEESARDAAESRRHFHMKTVEYGIKLNEVNVKRKFELVENVVALVYTNFSFFHQAYDALKDLEPSMRELTGLLQKSRMEHARQPAPQANSLLLPPEYYDPASSVSETKSTRTSSTIYKAGYLYKKSSSKMRTVWHRRFFELGNWYLGYFSIEGKDEAKTTVDLRICMVKETPTPERRFCFDLVSPTKTLTLQAQNEAQLKDWISALQAAISRSISDEGAGNPGVKPSFADPTNTTSHLQGGTSALNAPQKAADLLERVRSVPGNDTCADCGSDQDVEWASCNLGIIVCITCSGIHRGLGRHVSKVKSLSLDRWDQLEGDILLTLGNKRVNELFEGNLKDEDGKPKPDDDRAKKQKYSVQKYNAKAFLRPATTPFSTPPLTHDYLLELLASIAHGSNVNEKDLNGQTLLHKAASVDASVVEFLLLWNADFDAVDEKGWTPLHCAADAGNAKAVTAILRRTPRTDVTDKDGKLPIDLAIAKSTESSDYVHIVTTLRLTHLDKQDSASWRSTGWEDGGTNRSQASAEQPRKHSGFSATAGSIPTPDILSTPTKDLPVLPGQGSTLPPPPAGAISDPWAEEKNAWE
ncbi:uncharacterized protein EV422DRAFT_192422 [Fimicolochytrium jonesii]|uniref:uncharacterized protein n=1 Tax=Fimicolochytrium jonesii TaxID=1396493 RepID=UPI0022FE2620|nr:uncharacterized protein EV422DRAFT_192422 [Fimicolochytrium jonesii]KAI8818158.1 hypothetical protein EV422DRAFT_192422 [Fimicolochytrium jonesii]